MPYQGSAQSIGFRNRTVIDPSKRMREEAAQLKERGRERIYEMEKQASQQTREMQRVSDIQSSNTRYELEALSQFSNKLTEFIKEDVVELEKRRIEGEIEEGKRIYAEQGPAFQQQQEEVQNAANRSYDLDVKTTEMAAKIPDDEGADRVRNLSRWKRHGYELAAMKEAGQNFGFYLDSELTNNPTLIKDPNGGPDFKINEYKGEAQYEAAVNYLQNDYIKNHNPAGLSAKVVNTLLIPEVNLATQNHRKQYYRQQKTERATIDLETANISLTESLNGTAGFPAPDIAINGFLVQTQDAYRRQGVANPRQAAKDALIDSLKARAVANPEDVEDLITTIDGVTIKGHPAGEKSLFALYGNQISPNKLRAAAIKQEVDDYNTNKADRRIDAEQAVEAYKQSVEDGLSGTQQQFALAELEEKYGVFFPDLVNGARSYSPLRYSYEQSLALAESYSKTQGGEISREQLLTLHPRVAQEYESSVVDTLFADGMKTTIQEQTKKIDGEIRSAIGEFDTNKALRYDSINARAAAQKMIVPEAQKLFEEARNVGKPITKQRALELAGDRISQLIADGKDNASSLFYYTTDTGFLRFKYNRSNNPVLSRQLEEMNRVTETYRINAFENTNPAINTNLQIPTNRLELTANGRPDSIFFSLAQLDKQHNAFEILNAQRAKNGLAAVEMPREAQVVDRMLKQYPDLKPLFLSQQSHNRINRGVEQISVSAPNLMKALGLQESGGNYKAINWKTGMAGNPAVGKYQILWKNVLAWSKQYGMPHPGTMDDFRNSPQYQEVLATKAFENYIQQAARRSNDPNVIIRMAAAAWYGGPRGMDNWDNPNFLGANPTDPNMQEYTMQVLEKYKRGTF